MTPNEADVLIVGAGMCGLTAAKGLRTQGRSCLVLDKGRAPGGRMATRRYPPGGPAQVRFDHGAQFFTARDERFASLAAGWVAAGVVRPWHHDARGEIRYAGVRGMRAICEEMAWGLPVQTGVRVDSISLAAGLWQARSSDQTRFTARVLLLTAPVPQSLALLDAGGMTLPEDARARLEEVAYDPCVALLATLTGEPAREPYGEPAAGNVSWFADNFQKGISPAPCATLHLTAAASRECYGWEDSMICSAFLPEAEALLGVPCAGAAVHRWRFARPAVPFGEPALCIETAGAPLVLAGDAFGGGRVEGAAVSGFAAADLLKGVL